MAIETELRALVVNDGTLAGLVAGRVYPVVLPKEPTLPALVYQEINTDTVVAADGDTGLRVGRYQWNYYAVDEYAATKIGRAALIAALNGYRGGTIDRIEMDRFQDDFDTGEGWFRQMMDTLVWYKE